MAEIRETRQDGRVRLAFSGRMDHEECGRLWERLQACFQGSGAEVLVCDLREVSFIDTAGIALLLDLRRRCAERGRDISFENLPETAERFLDSEPTRAAEAAAARGRPGWIARLGMWCSGRLSSAHGLVCFLGAFVAACFLLIRNPRQIHFRDLLFHVQQVGAAAAFLICAINALTGMVVVFQGESIAMTFGAPIYVANMVAGSIPGQMAPVLTAILIAGRSGTSFAAKIGTMKVQQELDVLAAMNFNLFSFLVLPRVLAISLVTPLLTMLADAAGILGGLLTAVGFFDLSAVAFMNEVQATLQLTDIAAGLIKGLVFGLVIGLTGCFHGLRTESTADSVGLRTTASVVSSIFIIILVNTGFAALFSEFGW